MGATFFRRGLGLGLFICSVWFTLPAKANVQDEQVYQICLDWAQSGEPVEVVLETQLLLWDTSFVIESLLRSTQIYSPQIEDRERLAALWSALFFKKVGYHRFSSYEQFYGQLKRYSVAPEFKVALARQALPHLREWIGYPLTTDRDAHPLVWSRILYWVVQGLEPKGSQPLGALLQDNFFKYPLSEILCRLVFSQEANELASLWPHFGLDEGSGVDPLLTPPELEPFQYQEIAKAFVGAVVAHRSVTKLFELLVSTDNPYLLRASLQAVTQLREQFAQKKKASQRLDWSSIPLDNLLSLIRLEVKYLNEHQWKKAVQDYGLHHHHGTAFCAIIQRWFEDARRQYQRVPSPENKKSVQRYADLLITLIYYPAQYPLSLLLTPLSPQNPLKDASYRLLIQLTLKNPKTLAKHLSFLPRSQDSFLVLMEIFNHTNEDEVEGMVQAILKINFKAVDLIKREQILLRLEEYLADPPPSGSFDERLSRQDLYLLHAHLVKKTKGEKALIALTFSQNEDQARMANEVLAQWKKTIRYRMGRCLRALTAGLLG